ncbi:MAG: 1-acyl-sn-glycerol-3-phosphate acyltransferase, partial [Alphaproteobacteria bacterium]|nr:1-acyl-sn-glycerol-3-phosphate acyltransferase [Alphaproteobacteria bacterium]
VVYDLLAPIPPGVPQKEMMATLQDVIETSSAALLAEARAARSKSA